MKKLLVLTMVIAMAGMAIAQADDAVNGVGVYFDDCGTMFCDNPAPFTPGYNIYILLVNPSESHVKAWEMDLGIDNLSLAGMFNLFGGIDVGSDGVWPAHAWSHYFAVGNGGAPLEPNACGAIVLAQYTGYFIPLDMNQPVTFYLRGDPNSASFPGAAAGGYAPEPGVKVEFVHPTGGDAETPVAMLGPDCAVVGTQETSWSAVKGLFK